jgi:hypothetical protein
MAASLAKPEGAERVVLPCVSNGRAQPSVGSPSAAAYEQVPYALTKQRA